jgi:DNA-binding transcriptional LysR family regulator
MKQLVEMVVFARVVESRGFTAAARLLGMTTSAVSRSVTRLEAHFGARLLNRSTRAVSVTELGEAVYAGCATIAETARELEALTGHHAHTPSGQLKISAPVTFGQLCVVPHLPRFMELWPEVDIRLDLTDRIVDVVAESYDVAIRIAPRAPLGMVARPLGTTSTMLVASRRYLATAGVPGMPDDLTGHASVFMECAEAKNELRLRRGSDERCVPINVRLTINNGAAIVAAVCEDMGIGLVRDYAARAAIEQGFLVQLLPEWSLAGRHCALKVQAIYSPTRHLPRKVRAFIDFAVSVSANGRAHLRSLDAQAA